MTVKEAIRLVANEFDSVEDEKLEQWIEFVSPMVSKKQFGKLYEQALALLVAHHLKMSGCGDSTFGDVGDSLRVSSYSEGGTSVSFAVSQATNLTPDAELTLTKYGLSYLAIRRMVIIPIRSSGEL